MSSSLGGLFRISTFGESHGTSVGAVVDGCPPGLPLSEADLQPQLTRRRPGQNQLVTPRQEADKVRICSGVENGLTLGTPILLLVGNTDQRTTDYKKLSAIPRPSHADFTYQMKYGLRSASGGGRASARETIGRVAAAGIAEKWLHLHHQISIVAWVSAVGPIEAPTMEHISLNRGQVDAQAMRCPHGPTAERMQALVETVLAEQDSVGGVVSCLCSGAPAGWGEPVFDKLEARLAQAMLSLPATKGFEIGSGFAGSRMRGSTHNDPFVLKDGRLGTSSNRSGGVQGGISNGEPIFFRVAFKPPATIGLPQETTNFDGKQTLLAAKGRHDPCVVVRAVPIVESMAALVLMDLALQQASRQAASACLQT